MDKMKIIVIEGHDRTGKDTLLNDLKKHKDIYIFEVPTSEEYEKNEKVSYKDHSCEPMLFRDYLRILNKLVEIERSGKYKYVILYRLLLSDNVFSKLWNRNKIFETYFNKAFNYYFDFSHYVLLWDNYEELLNRLNKINEEDIPYNKEDFNKIKSYFEEETKKIESTNKTKINFIKCDTKKEEVYNNFLEFIKEIDK